MNNESNRVLDWFALLARDMILTPQKVHGRIATTDDMRNWAALETRMREIADILRKRGGNVHYAPYDLTAKSGQVYRFSPSGFFLWVGANMRIISCVPELRKIGEAWEISRATAAEIGRIEYKGDTSNEKVQERVQAAYRRNFKQLTMIFDEDDTPHTNRGVNDGR